MLAALKLDSLLVGLVCWWTCVTFTLAAEGVPEFNRNDCGRTKSCVEATFDMIISRAYDRRTKTIRFEMSGKTDGYLAIGFSRDDRMGDDSVVACLLKNGVVTVEQSYNLRNLDNIGIQNPSAGLSNINGAVNNGKMVCSFDRLVTSSGTNIFDLSLGKYFLLLAAGPVEKSGELEQHTGNKRSSTTTKYKLTSVITNNQGGPGDIDPDGDNGGGQVEAAASPNNRPPNNNMLRAHACLMLSAWVLCGGLGVILARYYKTAWPENTLFDLKIWFQFHRALMVMVLLLTAAGFIIIFIEIEEFRGPEDGAEFYDKSHPILGTIVMALVLLNPLMALLRCNPKSDYRVIFNWLHWFVGTSAFVLAVITIFFGMRLRLMQLLLPDDNWVTYVMAGYTGFHVFASLVLEINKFATNGRAKPKHSYQMSTLGEDAPLTKEREPCCDGLLFNYTMIFLYTLVAIGCWLAMVLPIADKDLW